MVLSRPAATPAAARPFHLHRLGTIMAADPANPDEALGVLNPACCRDRDGELLLFPRVVAAGNYSRIGLARVCFRDSEPVGVARRGYALEPTEGFERNASTAGVEDPRVTFIAALDRYVMTYTAFGPLGPRIAIAISDDAHAWSRLGPVDFAYAPGDGTDFDLYKNKDGLLFPEPVRDPHGRLALALIHRPEYAIPWQEGGHTLVLPTGITETRASMWISYVPLDAVRADVVALTHWHDHRLLAAPEQPWEAAKIGGGTPPLLTSLGWLTIYHGVGTTPAATNGRQPRPRYCAGALILDRDDPRRILYRSPEPILTPDTAEGRLGIVDNVVFPTASDPRGDGRIDVYYGMADALIGVARLTLPATLPS